MGLSHPAIDTRDIALFLPFRRSLRVRANQMIPMITLVTQLLGRNIGLHGEHPVRIQYTFAIHVGPCLPFVIYDHLGMVAGGTCPSRHGPLPFLREGLGRHRRLGLVALRAPSGRLRLLFQLSSGTTCHFPQRKELFVYSPFSSASELSLFVHHGMPRNHSTL